MTAPNYDDDLSNAYLRQRESRQASSDSEYLDNFISGGTQETAEPAPRQEMGERETWDFFKQAAKSGAKAIVGGGVDVVHGTIEAPLQTVGGIEEGLINAPLQAIHEFGTWANENLADLGEFSYTPETGLQFTSHAKAKEIAEKYGYDPNTPFALPVPAEADSVTGGIIRNISKYVSGFVGAGKVLKVAGVPSAATAAGKVGEFMLRGALADAIEFGPNDPRLSDLLQKVPALQNPVTEYLASDPEDGAAEGRFKNAVEGLGLGVAGLALEKILGAVRAGIKAKAAARAVPGTTEEAAQLPIRMVKREDIETLLSDRPVQRALPIEEGKAVSPSEIVERPSVELENGEVYFNFNRIDEPDELKSVLQTLGDIHADEIREAQRGVQTWVETKLKASKLDAWKILTDRRKGEPLNAEQTVKLTNLWLSSGKKVEELAELAFNNPTPANEFAFRKMEALHNLIQKQVVGARTETARAFAIWRMMKGSDAELSRQIGDVIDYMGGSATTQDMAKRVLTLSRAGRDAELEAFIATSAWAKTKDAITAAWYFSMLSGPPTHMRNIASGLIVAPQQVYERKLANLIGQMFGEENVAKGEEIGQLVGMIEGYKEALRISAKGRRILREAGEVALTGGKEGREAAREMLRYGQEEFGTVYRTAATGESGIGMGKLEFSPSGAFSSAKWELDADSAFGRSMDIIDAVVGSAGRALMAEDELFKTIGYRMELHALARRKVAQEIRAGTLENNPEAIKARTVDIISDPEETIRLASQDAARYQTFTDPMGQFGKRLEALANSIPVLGRYVFPFRRTAMAIPRYGFERTPLAFKMSHVQDQLKAGGAQRDIALARIASGTMIMMMLTDLAMDGKITGAGPSNPNQRATLRRQGVKPYAFKVGDRYWQFRGVEPFAQPAGIAANLVEIGLNTDWEDDNAELDELIMASILAVAEQTTNPTFMSGFSDFFEAMSDPRRYGEGYFKRAAGAFAPTGGAEIARAIDPNMKAVEDLIDAYMARTPVLSKLVPDRHDAFGHVESYRSGLGSWYDFISPIYSSKANAAPIEKELNRLELWIGNPNKRASFSPDMIRGFPGSGSVTVDLSRYPKAYERYKELQGDLMTRDTDNIPLDPSGLTQFQALNALVTGAHIRSVAYARGTDGSDGEKATMIRNIRNKYLRAARAQLLNEFPELRQEVIRRMPQEWIGQ